MKHPKYKHIPMPRLTDDTKKMNGKSSRRLSQSIIDLSDLLDECEEVKDEEMDNEPRDLNDFDTE